MKKIFYKVDKMSPNFWLILICIFSVLLAFSAFMLKRAEQKEGQSKYNELKEGQQIIISNVKEIRKTLATTDSVSSQEWIRIDFVNVTEGIIDCRSSDYIFLLFKASSGIINGEFKIEGLDEIYSFSTRSYANLPLPVKNQEIPEEGRYESFPNFEYRIKKKTVSESKLSIILFAVSEAGRTSPIKLEKPIDMKKD
jgi:preprotein translocase subunit YajC